MGYCEELARGMEAMDVDAVFRLPPGCTLVEQAGPKVTFRQPDGQLRKMRQLRDGSLVDAATYRKAERDRVSAGANGVVTVRHDFAGAPLGGYEPASVEQQEQWRLHRERWAGRSAASRPSIEQQEQWRLHREGWAGRSRARDHSPNTNDPLMKIVGTVDGRPITRDEQIQAEKWHRRHPNEPKPAAMTAGDDVVVGIVGGRPVTMGEFDAAIDAQRRNPGAPPPPEMALAGTSFSVP